MKIPHDRRDEFGFIAWCNDCTHNGKCELLKKYFDGYTVFRWIAVDSGIWCTKYNTSEDSEERNF